jgi:hypothetical protein
LRCWLTRRAWRRRVRPPHLRGLAPLRCRNQAEAWVPASGFLLGRSPTMKTGPLLLRPSRIRRVSRRRRLVMVHPKSPCLTSLSRLGTPCTTLNPPPRGLCSGRQTFQVRWPLLDQRCAAFGSVSGTQEGDPRAVPSAPVGDGSPRSRSSFSGRRGLLVPRASLSPARVVAVRDDAAVAPPPAEKTLGTVEFGGTLLDQELSGPRPGQPSQPRSLGVF